VLKTFLLKVVWASPSGFDSHFFFFFFFLQIQEDKNTFPYYFSECTESLNFDSHRNAASTVN